MKIPASIQIGQLTYQVIQDDRIWDDHGEYGMANKRDQEIRIDIHLKPDHQEMIFIHEVIHLAFETSGLTYRLEKEQKIEEEDIVRSLETVVYQVVKQMAD